MIILHLRLILHDDLDRSNGQYEWIYCCLKQLIVDKQEKNDDNDYMLVDDTIYCYMSTPMTVQLMIDEDTK